MPGWLSGDSTCFVSRDTNTGGSSPSPGTIFAPVRRLASNQEKANWITCRFESCRALQINKYVMRSSDFIPTFTIVMGGAGSGKNHFIEHHPALRRQLMIDVDQIKQTVPLDQAIKAIKPMLEKAFAAKKDVVHPTTGSNLKGQQNKIELAKSFGYRVQLILVATDPEVAAQQVAKRVSQGGHGVEAADIARSNQKARENFEALTGLVDKFEVVSPGG
jgi:predicted ABC-type ATPase